MLILSRRGGEVISIGADVEVTVLEVSGEHVRLGITAPRSVPVLRKELREEVARENRLAASPVGRGNLRLGGQVRLPRTEEKPPAPCQAAGAREGELSHRLPVRPWAPVPLRASRQ